MSKVSVLELSRARRGCGERREGVRRGGGITRPRKKKEQEEEEEEESSYEKRVTAEGEVRHICFLHVLWVLGDVLFGHARLDGDVFELDLPRGSLHLSLR